jgi:3-oxoacyl-(acyl-carrier-protein) synthase
VRLAITGKYAADSSLAARELERLEGRMKRMRLVHGLERLAIATAGCAMLDAGMVLPCADPGLDVYIGVDDAIEDLKDEYFRATLEDGLLGASPLLFPFTSPNTLAAQVSIAFNIRGGGMVMPVGGLCPDVIDYAARNVMDGHARRALAGNITVADRGLSAEGGRYAAVFSIIEREDDALKRGARIYSLVEAGASEGL